MRAESLYIDDDGQDYGDEELFPYPSNPPQPQPPQVAKMQLYRDPLVFADIDQIAISVEALINQPTNRNLMNPFDWNAIEIKLLSIDT